VSAFDVTPRALFAVRAIAFICVTGLAALILNVALFIALAANDGSRYEPTECEYDEVKCGALMEFVYDDTWPLFALLLVVPAALVGWLVARRSR
jgi:hypothetical protein